MIATLNQLVSPSVIGLVIDKLTNAEYADIYRIGSYYLILVVVCAIADFGKNHYFMRVSYAIARDLKGDLYSNIINKDIEFFDEHKTGELRKNFAI